MSGVPLTEIGGAVFVKVWPALIKRFGNANLAIVWQWVYFRTAPKSRAAYDHEGERWWCANRDEIADETGLRSDQVRRSLESLEKLGYLEGAHHALGGPWDRKRSYRCILANTHMADLPDASGESAMGSEQSEGFKQSVPPPLDRRGCAYGKSAKCIWRNRRMHWADPPDAWGDIARCSS